MKTYTVSYKKSRNSTDVLHHSLKATSKKDATSIIIAITGIPFYCVIDCKINKGV